MKRPLNEPRACERCRESFLPSMGWQKFCSPKCRTAAYTKTLDCEHCGESFTRPANSRSRCCSYRCSSAQMAQSRAGGTGRFGAGTRVGRYPQPAVCLGCGKDFMRKRAKTRFCTQACALKHNNTQRQAAAAPKWGCKAKGEDGCRACLRPASHLHHIVPRSKSRAARADIDGNGLPLCFDCHRGWHDRRVTIHHDVLNDQEFLGAVGYAGGWWVEHNYPDRPEVALMAMDEQVKGRVLRPDRPETFAERHARLLPLEEAA